jgi:hypothetical protein
MAKKPKNGSAESSLGPLAKVLTDIDSDKTSPDKPAEKSAPAEPAEPGTDGDGDAPSEGEAPPEGDGPQEAG